MPALALILPAAQCSRLMRVMGIQGAIGSKPLRTTISDKAATCPQ